MRVFAGALKYQWRPCECRRGLESASRGGKSANKGHENAHRGSRSAQKGCDSVVEAANAFRAVRKFQ